MAPRWGMNWVLGPLGAVLRRHPPISTLPLLLADCCVSLGCNTYSQGWSVTCAESWEHCEPGGSPREPDTARLWRGCWRGRAQGFREPFPTFRRKARPFLGGTSGRTPQRGGHPGQSPCGTQVSSGEVSAGGWEKLEEGRAARPLWLRPEKQECCPSSQSPEAPAPARGKRRERLRPAAPWPAWRLSPQRPRARPPYLSWRGGAGPGPAGSGIRRTHPGRGVC